MKLGECRWVGQENVHVYCFGSRASGAYDPNVKVFKVVTGPCDVWSHDGWLTADEATKTIMGAA
jgi:hypothetical protein